MMEMSSIGWKGNGYYLGCTWCNIRIDYLERGRTIIGLLDKLDQRQTIISVKEESASSPR